MQRRGDVDDRHLLARVHEVANAEESLAEFSARMEKCEVFFLESFSQQQRHRERVAEGECRSR